MTTKEWYKAHPEYRVWQNMKNRASNKRTPDYVNYGGRGIKVCDRWLKSYCNFIEDMGPRPNPSYQLDRIDNDGNYTPENCRWTTRTVQKINQRKYKNNTSGYRGVYKVSNGFTAKIGVNRQLIHLGRYDTLEEALAVREEAEGKYHLILTN